MFLHRVRVERVAADGAVAAVPVRQIDNFCMRNFTNDAVFDDTLPVGDGLLEVGSLVPREALREAMEAWFRRKGYLQANEVLRVHAEAAGTVESETMTPINCEPLKALIRTVPDFPKPGILFYDITTLLKDKAGFAQMIDAFAAYYIDKNVDLVLGIEARGFIFGPAMAYRLNAGFVPVRKPKKLPAPVAKVTYDLEYGSDSLEIHLDAIQPGQRVVIVDDLLATGGTMQATVQLVKQLGGEIMGVAFAVELDFLKGRQKFPEYDVYSLLHYDE